MPQSCCFVSIFGEKLVERIQTEDDVVTIVGERVLREKQLETQLIQNILLEIIPKNIISIILNYHENVNVSIPEQLRLLKLLLESRKINCSMNKIRIHLIDQERS